MTRRARVEIPAAPQAREARETTLDLLRQLLAEPWGRELATWLVIDHLGARNRLFATIGNSEATAYGAGSRDKGIELEDLLEAANGPGWGNAVAERRAALTRATSERENARRSAEKAQETDDG